MAVTEFTRAYSAPAGAFGRVVTRAVAAVATWNAARRTREALSQLSDRELEDIGLSRSDIDKVSR